MIIKRIMIIGALFSLSFNLFAASSAEDCAAITDDSKRLKCYDEFLKQKQTEAQKPEKTVTPAEPEQPAVAQPEPETTAEEKFGSEQLSSEQKKELDEIHSRAIGKFKKWEKGMVVELENGQAWEITDSRGAYHKTENPKITIEKGLFNSYRLGIEGLNKRFRVKRKK